MASAKWNPSAANGDSLQRSQAAKSSPKQHGLMK
jgi:hypothetical protein